MLFLTAGNILAVYRTKSVSRVRGVLRLLPTSGALWVMGLFAITGSPPFGTFLSEFTILKGALDQGRALVAVVYLVLMAVIFLGMMTAMLGMAQGREQGEALQWQGGESLWAVAPPAALGALVLALGLYVPECVRAAIEQAARALG
jgi:hydrogenase-4 component F